MTCRKIMFVCVKNHVRNVKSCACTWPWSYIGGVEMQLHSFVTSELDGYEWSASHTSCCTPGGQGPITDWTWGWMGEEPVRMFWWRKFLFLLVIEPWIVQPIAWSLHQLRYTSLCSYRWINVSNTLAVCSSSSITVIYCIYQNVEIAVFRNSSCLTFRHHASSI